MINHFKAEFYKLRHSKILITILGVCAAVIMVSFALGDVCSSDLLLNCGPSTTDI